MPKSSAFAAFFICLLLLTPAAALAADTGSVAGTVHSSDGAPVSGAAITLNGPSRLSTSTDAKGAFSFPTVPAGLYRLVVTKPGFTQHEIDDVAAFIGETANITVVLTGSTFSSLRTIAQVTTSTPGHVQINTTTAAVNTISSQTFVDQGQTQVTKILNQTPGIIAWGSPENNNGASKGSPQVVQIRGALPYETESLVDGHPTPLGLSGSFNPIYLNPAVLQDVELVKGPGAMPTEINYAIGGTVNYITLQPTATPRGAVSIGVDNWGGVTSALRATGSLFNNRVAYAIAYATDGAPGPLRNYPVAGSQLYLIQGSPPWTINGQQLLAFPEVVGPAPPSRSKYIGVVGEAQFEEPLYVCCSNISTGFNSRAQLAKLRFNFSQSSALTISYLGGQGFINQQGVDLTSLSPVGSPPTGSFSIFAPPPGYTGSVPAGTEMPFDLSAFEQGYQSAQQNLYQGEFRTTFGSWTALARYFSGMSNEFVYVPATANAPFTFGGKTWGGVPLCPLGYTANFGTGMCDLGAVSVAPTMTFFNGQHATFAANDAVNSSLELDHVRGGSVELSRDWENGAALAFSFDRSHHDSSTYEDNPPNGIVGYTLPPGSSQQFTTEMVRGRLQLTSTLSADLANYFIQYTSHFTGDGGATWSDATHGYVAPRLALSWRPNVDVAWRLSAGASIAPPYVSLLSSPGSTPQPNINGVPAAGFTENRNNGQILPETAWGYDLGLDKRIAGSMSISTDLYLVSLRNEFLPSTFLDGTYTPPPGQFGAGQPWPLYVSEVANLGHARYQGIEVVMQDSPAIGVGFRLQGNLQQAYAYGLPANFYCAAFLAGKCISPTNLGILPNINFQASGLGWNTINGTAVPYSMGYGEINRRWLNGAYLNLGMTYYGSNNAYSQPAFFIMSGAVREPLGHRGLTIQLSVDNLLGSYNNSWTQYFGGIPAPLHNGQLGPTIAGNYGPTTWRLVFSQELGQY